MRVWRIDRMGRNPLEGAGGMHVAGRWNARGRRIVYASAHLSLAILEKLVHVNPDQVPDNLAAIEIDLPDGNNLIDVLPPASLPRDWRDQPPSRSTQQLGEAWLADPARPPVLVVPSAVVPREVNYLLNPAHPGAGAWTVVHVEPFSFDPRLV
jgi:RES domain-containing protein